jgi:glycosyltransferase involved in cell wall biosynthesis
MSTDTARADVAILSGGWDRPYAFGLTDALVRNGLRVELIAGDDLTDADFGHPRTLRVLNYRVTNRAGDSVATRLRRLASYYIKLIAYAWRSRAPVFHILWNNGYDTFDRVVLMLYYRLLGRVVCLTAHNVNAGARDNRDSFVNRATLKFQYRLCHHVFVHTAEMKADLVAQFDVRQENVTVIPFGINNAVPRTAMTSAEARQRLGCEPRERVLLFFGNIAPYKGVEYLVQAMPRLLASCPRYRLVIAGRVKPTFADYWATVEQALAAVPRREQLTLRTEYIPDEETEIYFKAADLLILPYTHIFQSGVLFLGYSFGLPSIVTDVGSLKDDVVAGETGFACAPRDAGALVDAIERYFASALAAVPDAVRRRTIAERAERSHSWDTVAALTRGAYTQSRGAGAPAGLTV